MHLSIENRKGAWLLIYTHERYITFFFGHLVLKSATFELFGREAGHLPTVGPFLSCVNDKKIQILNLIVKHLTLDIEL